MTTLLVSANAAHSAGNWIEADRLCRGRLRECPIDAAALDLLAELHVRYGDEAEGARLQQQSLRYVPDNPAGWDRLARCALSLGKLEETAQWFTEVFTARPAPYRSYHALGRVWYRLQRRAETALVYAEWVRQEPNNPEARHLAMAASGGDVAQRCAEDYVGTYFDAFAGNFDEVLLNTLDYRGPQMVAETLRMQIGAETAALTVLDAGCGTGLCGPLIRRYCRRLVGVDRSPKMLDQARARKVYDELLEGELVAFIEAHPETFDMIISADVLVYFGALEEVMSAAYRALTPHGLFVFTTEALVDSDESPYSLGLHGRYSHRERYLRAVLDQCGFEVLTVTLENIRRELEGYATGYCVTARKRD